MKIALILTGFARHYSRTFGPIKEFLLDKYDVDIYISSWNKIETKYNPHNSRQHPESKQIIDLHTGFLSRLYGDKLIDYKLHDYDEYYKNRFKSIEFINRENDIFKTDKQAKDLGSFWVERLRDQWYIVQQGWNLIKNKEQYDIFFKIRFDLYLLIFAFKESNLVLVPSEFPYFEITDYMAYGNYDSMNKYCNMFDHIENMYKNHNTNIAVSEKMLQFYLKEYCKINYLVDKGLVYRRLKKQ